MSAVNEPSTTYRTVNPMMPVEVFVAQDGMSGWFDGELREWAHYETWGWTATVTYSLGSAQRHIGRFLAEHVREHTDA